MSKLLLYCCLTILFCCCHDSYDPALETPDIDAAGMSHGYNLTPLGCLLYTPMTCYERNNGFNIQILKDNQEISSYGSPYSELQKELVFELQRNGTVHYWFKKDYIKSPIDTINILEGQKAYSHTIYHGDQLNDRLKHLYITGKWQVNFKDSTLKIDFGKNNFSLTPLEGKYTALGAGTISFQQTFMFDSLVNGKREIFKKLINTYYESY